MEQSNAKQASHEAADYFCVVDLLADCCEVALAAIIAPTSFLQEAAGRSLTVNSRVKVTNGECMMAWIDWVASKG